MKRPLKILLLENNSADAKIIQQKLRKEQKEIEFHLASNKKSYLHALEEFDPDVILSNNSLPQFDALDALTLARQKQLFVPFILVTGTVSEEYAAEIIRQGADDYILKDRMARLPAAIGAALAKRKYEKEVADYKYALDQSADVTIADQNGIIIYANDNFCELYGYTKEELIGKNHRIINSGYHPLSFFQSLWETISKGHIWQGEVRNKAKNGDYLWADTTIVPLVDNKRKPYQFLAIRKDITRRKKAEEDLVQAKVNFVEQQKQEQIKITAIVLEAQEKERNAIGRELHDNVNQILVGTKMMLSMVKSNPEKISEIVETSIKNLQDAINENRKISHVMVAPDLGTENLVEQIDNLIATMLESAGMKVKLDTKDFDEDLLDDQRKINIYRIAQEQCTNIVKYAKARSAKILLQTKDALFKMLITDDGVGMENGKPITGIGLRNISGRLSIFNGTSRIITAPGEGFSLEIIMPY